MDIDDSFLNNAKFDSNAIPKNIPNDTLENVIVVYAPTT